MYDFPMKTKTLNKLIDFLKYILYFLCFLHIFPYPNLVYELRVMNMLYAADECKGILAFTCYKTQTIFLTEQPP
jgi:hypothetical protein